MESVSSVFRLGVGYDGLWVQSDVPAVPLGIYVLFLFILLSKGILYMFFEVVCDHIWSYLSLLGVYLFRSFPISWHGATEMLRRVSLNTRWSVSYPTDSVTQTLSATSTLLLDKRSAKNDGHVWENGNWSFLQSQTASSSLLSVTPNQVTPAAEEEIPNEGWSL